MGPKKVKKSQEQIKSVGRITIKTTRETMPYTVKFAKDTRTGELLSTFRAIKLKILDVNKGTYQDMKTKTKMLIGDAVDLGLVEIQYDLEAEATVQEEVMKTYSVHAVVDQQEKSKIPFHAAVARGIIDPDTGGYVNTVTGERIPAEDAIKRGLIKATAVDNPDSVSVDEMGSRVAERGVNVIKKKLLSPLKVLKSMKQ